MTALEELEKTAIICNRCNLFKTRHKVVFGGGNPSAEIFLIGEAPGHDEDISGKVFVGKAGQLLDKIFEACNFNRKDHVYISNILKCRPPGNRNPETEEQKACLPWLFQQIDLVDPKILILLGSVPSRVFLGHDFKITREHGQWSKYFDRWVMPTYHPSALLRNPNLKKGSWEDFKKVIIKYRELVDSEHYCQYI
jgi:uracil-DNA glycosylase family 4